MNAPAKASSYLGYLPAIYQDEPLLGSFLLGFEELLEGGQPDGVPVEGLEDRIVSIPELFDPSRAPKELLAWLAGWVALVLREDWEALRKDWDEEPQRALLRDIVSLYPIRGTRKGLERYLKIYAGSGVTVVDSLAPMRIGFDSTVGRDTVVEGMPAHCFLVSLRLSEAETNLDRIKSMRQAVEELVDLEKPAHTYYPKPIQVHGMSLQIGVKSSIGKDTII